MTTRKELRDVLEHSGAVCTVCGKRDWADSMVTTEHGDTCMDCVSEHNLEELDRTVRGD